jgi:hypothetical protein
MSSTIPTSATVRESAVIEASLSSVWHLIKLPDFASFLSNLKASVEVKGTSPDTDVVKWTYNDGTVLEVKQEEHSVMTSGDCISACLGLMSRRPLTTTSLTRSSVLSLL